MNDGPARLAALEPGCSTDDALALFDDLPVVPAEEITGRWRGRELATGHPFDGLLTASGWYGKQFDSPESVHPLLFTTPAGQIFSGDPRKVPIGLAGRVPVTFVEAGHKLLGVIEPVLRTRKPRARLRNLDYRGKVSAAMLYDHLPIIDIFRRVDDTTLLGVMDRRGVTRPFFFVLAREARVESVAVGPHRGAEAHRSLQKIVKAFLADERASAGRRHGSASSLWRARRRPDADVRTAAVSPAGGRVPPRSVPTVGTGAVIVAD